MNDDASRPPHGDAHIALAPSDFDDWPALLALLQSSFASMDGRIDPPSSLQRMGVDELRAKAAQEQLVVARAGDALLGCVFAARRDDCVHVGKLAVAPHARGRGIARRMIALVESMARAHGLAEVELQTRVELVENHATFAALGFRRVAETSHPGYDRPTSITMRKRIVAAASPHTG